MRFTQSRKVIQWLGFLPTTPLLSFQPEPEPITSVIGFNSCEFIIADSITDPVRYVVCTLAESNDKAYYP